VNRTSRVSRGLGLGLASCLVFVFLGLASAQEKKKDEPSTKEAPAGEKRAKADEKGKELPLPTGSKGEIAVMETNHGTIKIKFYADAAPKAVENFLGLAAKGYYNGVTFHRVIDGFMIQGGDPTGTGAGGKSLWGTEFEDEFSPNHRFERKGLLAMANRGPRTNGSQFFITLGPTPHLNNRHTIFGEVTEGMDVVEKIAKVQKGPRDKPVEAVVMKKVTVEAAPAKPSDPKAGDAKPGGQGKK